MAQDRPLYRWELPPLTKEQVIEKYAKKLYDDYVAPLYETVVYRQYRNLPKIENLYSAAYSLLARDNTPLSEGLYVFDYCVEQFIVRYYKQPDNHLEILKYWTQMHSLFEIAVKYLCTMFKLLDEHIDNEEKQRAYVGGKAHPKVEKTYQRSYRIWYETMVMKYSGSVANMLIDELQNERVGKQSVHVGLLRPAIGVFIDVGYNLYRAESIEKQLSIYSIHFEDVVMGAFSDYYKAVGTSWYENLSLVEFCREMISCIANEHKMNERFMHPTSHEKFIRAVYTNALPLDISEKWFEKHDSFRHILDDLMKDIERKDSPLPLIYDIYYKYDDYNQKLAAAFGEYAKRQLMALMTACKQNKYEFRFISILIDYYKRLCQIIERYFSKPKYGDDKGAPSVSVPLIGVESRAELNAETETKGRAVSAPSVHAPRIINGTIMECATQVFKDVINSDENFPLFLAKYANYILSKKSEFRDNTNAEYILDNIADLFSFIYDKDQFELPYQRYLAQRLLNNESRSDDFEKFIISKFILKCGYTWGSRLNTMINDVAISRKFNDRIHTALRNAGEQKYTDFDAVIVTTGTWPYKATEGGSLPPEMQQVWDHMRTFYQNSNPNRKIMPNLELGKVTLHVAFKNGARDLICTPIQAMAIMNLETPRSYLDLCAVIGIKATVAERHIMSLAHPKWAILQKNPPTAKLEGTHLFRLNLEFKSNARVIEVPLMEFAQDIQREISEDEQALVIRRKHCLDCCIVRIMKSRKTISHAELVAEVINNIKHEFSPAPAFIKQRIDDLIAQEYMQRSEKDRTIYEYLA